MDAQSLREQAAEADETMRRGRQQLVTAVRAASAAGMSQRQIADAIGRSQPEVNRLIRFHGDSTAGLALRRARPQVISTLTAAGLTNPRVFGSTARGEDHGDSDIDLLVTATQTVGLLGLSRVEAELSRIVGRDVDVVLDDTIRPDLSESILESAVRL